MSPVLLAFVLNDCVTNGDNEQRQEQMFVWEDRKKDTGSKREI